MPILGLNNDDLTQERSFDAETAQLFISFLNRLKAPVCLVAHNGWKFDYPVLKHVFHKIKMVIVKNEYILMIPTTITIISSSLPYPFPFGYCMIFISSIPSFVLT